MTDTSFLPDAGNPSVSDIQGAKSAREAERARARAAAAKLHAVTVRRLSAVRVYAFQDDSAGADNHPSWVLGRYWYSVAAAEALYPALHYLEVALRNAVFVGVGTRFHEPKGVDIPDCWLDWPASETVLYCAPKEPWRDDWTKVVTAKRAIMRDNRPVDAGRLIAELSFGFWTGLFAGHYGGREGDTDPKKLWPGLLPDVFPYLKEEDRKRKPIADRLTLIRHIRNRAFHHEPLWRRRLQQDVKLIIESIAWIDPVMAEVAGDATRSREVQERGIGGYEKRVRDFALRVLGDDR